MDLAIYDMDRTVTRRATYTPFLLHCAARRAPWRLILATASYRLYADAIAERLGFDDVIATGSIIGLDSQVHARIDGDNCYGPAKRRMIAEWVEKSGLTGKHGHVRFYSDHVSDAPAFEWADEPVAVNPHGKLRRLAEDRGWAIEDWG